MTEARAWKETLVVFKDDLRQELTSLFSLLLLAAYLLLNLLMTLPYVGLSNLITRKLVEDKGGSTATMALNVGANEMLSRAFTQLTGSASEGMAMASVPLPAMYTFFLAALFVPLLAVLTNADLLADDLRTGHIRYLALRCGRGSLLLGRVLSRGLLLGATVLAATLACYGLFLWKIEELPFGCFQHFLRFGLLLAAMAVTYTGLTALCSSLVRGSLLALVLGIVAVFGLGLVDLLGLTADNLGWATPNHYKLLLFSPNRWPLGLAAHLGFAAAFSALAWLRLRTRDL